MNRIEQPDLRIGYQSVCAEAGNERDGCAVAAYEADGMSINLMVVARGTQGRSPGIGKMAAEGAIGAIVETFDAAQSADIAALLAEGFATAAQRVAGIGEVAAACSAVVVAGGRLYLASCGDCRVFLVHVGLIQQVSATHTMSHQWVEQGTMTEEQLYSQPVRDMLTRSLGTAHPEADFRLRLNATDGDEQALANQGAALRSGDRLILCSGGTFPTMLFPRAYADYRLDIFEEPGDPQAAVDRFVSARAEMGWPAEMTIVAAEVG